MRDVLIATTILAASAYAAWSYEITPSDMPPAALMTDNAATSTPSGIQGDVESLVVAAAPGDASLSADRLTIPPRNPWRSIPMPMARPNGEIVLTASPVRPSLDIDVLHAGLIEIDGERHSLFGVDAPAVNQTCRNANSGLWACGSDARKAVAIFVEGRDVVCTPVVVAVLDAPAMSRCDAGSVDLNAWVVANGWAVADTAVDDRLVAAQGDARSRKMGLWTGWFEAPSEWRARHDDGVRVASRVENRV